MPFVYLIKDVAGAAAPDLSLVNESYFDSAGDGSAATITYTPSSHQAGDLLVALIGHNGDVEMASVPNGVTLQDPPGDLDNGATRFRLYTKVMDGLEGTLTWTIAATNKRKAYFAVIRGVDGTTPIVDAGGISESSASTGVLLPSLTVTRAGSWFIHGMLNDTDNPDVPTVTWPVQVLEAEKKVDDNGETYSSGLHVAIETGLSADTGTRQWDFADTPVNTESNQAIGIVIQKAESGGGGEPDPPGQIVDIPGANKLEAGTTGNNASTGGELTGTTNQASGQPDGTTVSGQRTGLHRVSTKQQTWLGV